MLLHISHVVTMKCLLLRQDSVISRSSVFKGFIVFLSPDLKAAIQLFFHFLSPFATFRDIGPENCRHIHHWLMLPNANGDKSLVVLRELSTCHFDKE